MTRHCDISRGPRQPDLPGPYAWADLPSDMQPWVPVELESGVAVAVDPRIGRWVPYQCRRYSHMTTIEAATYVPGAPPAGWAEVIPAGCSITTQAGSRAWLQVAGLTAPQAFYFRAVAPGLAGNAITIQVEVTADVGLLVGVVGTAIRFYGDSVLTSDRAAYQALIAATPAVAALITLESVTATDQLLAAIAATPLADGSDIPEIVIDAAAAGTCEIAYTPHPVLGAGELYGLVFEGYSSGLGAGWTPAATNNWVAVATTSVETGFVNFALTRGAATNVAAGITSSTTAQTQLRAQTPRVFACFAHSRPQVRPAQMYWLDGLELVGLAAQSIAASASNSVACRAINATGRAVFHLRHVHLYRGVL